MTEQYVCRVCGEAKERAAMKVHHGKATLICKACYNASQNTKRQAEREAKRAATPPAEQRLRLPLVLDPCPRCGIAQAAHWKCAKCDARGHATGRGSEKHPELCKWCEEELYSIPH